MDLRPLVAAAAALAIAGAAGTLAVQQDAAEPSRAELSLGPGGRAEATARLEAPDTAYVIVDLEAPRAAARVSIAAPGGEVAFEKTFSTRRSVDYFAAGEPGEHAVRVELLSPSPSAVHVEVGQTRSAATMLPAVALVMGVALGAGCAVFATARYITAQPDEKTR